MVDFDKKFVFPDIVEITLRPDLVLWFKEAKTIVAMELAIPKGRKSATRHTRPGIHGPNRRLQGGAGRVVGKRYCSLAIEVEGKGFPVQSVWKMFKCRQHVGLHSEHQQTQQRAHPAGHRRDESSLMPGTNEYCMAGHHCWTTNWRMLCYEVESSSKEIWRPSEDVENRKRFQVADSSRAYTSTECQDYISRITLSVSYFIYTGNKRQPEKTGDTGEKAARNGLVTGGKRQLLLPFFVRGHQNSYRTQ